MDQPLSVPLYPLKLSHSNRYFTDDYFPSFIRVFILLHTSESQLTQKKWTYDTRLILNPLRPTTIGGIHVNHSEDF